MVPVYPVVAVLQTVGHDVHLFPQRLGSLCYDACYLSNLGQLHLKPLVHVIILQKRKYRQSDNIQYAFILTCHMSIRISTLACHALMVPCLLRRAKEDFQGPPYQLEAVELAVMQRSSISPLSIPRGTEQPEEGD